MKVANLDHLGIVAGIIDEMGIVEEINTRIAIATSKNQTAISYSPKKHNAITPLQITKQRSHIHQILKSGVAPSFKLPASDRLLIKKKTKVNT